MEHSLLSPSAATLVLIHSSFRLVLQACFGAVGHALAQFNRKLTSAGILRQKGVELRSLDFLKQNILPLLLTASVALAVVVAEVRIIFPDG